MFRKEETMDLEGLPKSRSGVWKKAPASPRLEVYQGK